MATFVNDLVTRLVSAEVSHSGASTVNAQVLTVPENCDIVDVWFETTEAPAGSTAFNVRLGTTSGGTEIASDTNMQTGGRTRPTFTTAQLLAMAPVAPSGGAQNARYLYLRITPTGTATAGKVRVVVLTTQRALA
jgi:hypothetical protein